MKKIFLLFFLIYSLKFYSQWVNLNTGINDNLVGVVFYQNNGLTAGEHGLYYTTNGGLGASSWSYFDITDNQTNADIYHDTKFTHCYSSIFNYTDNGDVYACGQTETDLRAVIFKINIPSLSYELVYLGDLNTKLNKIDIDLSSKLFVGDDGLFIRMLSNNQITVGNQYIYENINTVSTYGGVSVGSDNNYWKTNSLGAINNNFTNINIKDVWNTGTYYAYGVGYNTFCFVSTNASSPGVNYNTNFNTPLTGTCLLYNNQNNRKFVGSDDGIYKYITGTSFQNGTLEFQPSSLNYKINEFWRVNNQNIIYACGDNGVILKTDNEGGATVPYVKLNVQGGCVNSPILIDAVKGSSNDAQWYINGQLVQNGINSFNHTFTLPGTYAITINVQNAFGETASDTKTIEIVPIPTVNLPTVVTDDILCKLESTSIQIQNSELNVKYTLKKEGEPNSNYGVSQNGNGSTISLTTDLIDLTGYYYLEASNVLATCSKRFDDNFLITVEETQASFHGDLINANLGELINFYNQSEEASSFNWQFNLNSQVQNFSTQNVQTSFNQIGETFVTLDSWSVNGCHDVLSVDNVQINDENTINDEGFIVGYDIEDFNVFSDEIYDLKLTSDGYVNCGKYKNAKFNTRVGKSISLDGYGGFLTKHNSNGVLKWIVYTNKLITGDFFSSVAVDNFDNIYVSGNGSGYFFDNNGNKYNLSNGLGRFFLAKLDSRGNLIWILQNSKVSFGNIYINANQYLYSATGIIQYSLYDNIPIYKNGIFLQNIGNTISATDSNFGLIKMDLDGNIVWDTEIKIVYTNGARIVDIEFDNNNNIYLTNSSESTTTYYSINGNNLQVLGNGTYGGKAGIVKYDQNGNCLWAIRTRTFNDSGYDVTDDTSINDISVDDNGNIYAIGRNECAPNQIYNYTHFFDNSDNTTTQTNKGTYFLAKISTDGVCEWIKSTDSKIFGTGNKIFIDDSQINTISNFASGNTIFNLPLQSINNTVNITHDKYNYLIVKYDLNGEIKKIVSNSNLNSNTAIPGRYRNFIKGEGDYYYITRQTYNGYNYSDFGMNCNIILGDNTYNYTLKCKDDLGQVLYDDNLLSEINYQTDNFSIYPNPSSGKFNIIFDKNYSKIELKIYDITGKLILKEEYNNSLKIVTNINVEKGVYLLKMLLDGTETVHKIIIQ